MTVQSSQMSGNIYHSLHCRMEHTTTKKVHYDNNNNNNNNDVLYSAGIRLKEGAHGAFAENIIDKSHQ